MRRAIAIACLVFAACSGPEVVEIGRFERFEAEVSNVNRYEDPYRDVQLNATFRSPEEEEIEVEGFYDGDDTWRVRFMPRELGRWTWSANFSDGTPGWAGTSDCVESDVPGMLDEDPNNSMWSGFSTGQPLLVRGLHIGDRFFASNWSEGARDDFLDWVVDHDYNLLSIASHYLNRDEPGRGRDWETPNLWPLDAEEYRELEAILDELAERRLMVFPFAGFFGQDSDYPRDPEDQERYVRYTLARLGAYWNILLNVAGPEPNLPGDKRWMSDEDVSRLGRMIAKLDLYQHPLSVHNRTGDDPFRNSDWTTYGVIQGPKTTNLSELNARLIESHHPSKPLLAQETLWSGNRYHIQSLGGEDYSDAQLRQNAIVIQMAAASLVFADNDGNSSSGFSGTLTVGSAKEERHAILQRVWDFFAELPIQQMRPRQDLVSAGYCLASPGERYLVYLPEAGTVSIQLEGGEYQVTWISARDTSERKEGEPTEDGQRLRPPAEPNAERPRDWFLYLTR